MQHMAALAKRGEVGISVVGGIVVAMSSRQHDARHFHGLRLHPLGGSKGATD